MIKVSSNNSHPTPYFPTRPPETTDSWASTSRHTSKQQIERLHKTHIFSILKFSLPPPYPITHSPNLVSIIRPLPLAQSINPRHNNQENRNTYQTQDSKNKDLAVHDRFVGDITGGEEGEVLEGGGGGERCGCHYFGSYVLSRVLKIVYTVGGMYVSYLRL